MAHLTMKKDVTVNVLKRKVPFGVEPLVDAWALGSWAASAGMLSHVRCSLWAAPTFSSRRGVEQCACVPTSPRS
ncbi:unnamed protein product [Cylicostephanus goldi]|uniref:Uncharacterized protein n=1 Tax=Cylicostephanus goldi TaxID=71465 RepID=A0A3P6RQI5_CYLGO|nr:unnamed protein product [Cylicostephanus goldi]